MEQNEVKTVEKSKNILKYLLIIIIGFLIIIAILFIVLLVRIGSSSKHSTCLTHDCIKTAAHILDYIDTSVDPCENFYEFACGHFLSTTSESVPHKKLDKYTKEQLTAIASEPTNDPSKVLQNLQKFYKNCMNLTEIENNYKLTFLTLIENFGGWPVLRGRFWNDKQFDWLNATLIARQLGFSQGYFININNQISENETKPELLITDPFGWEMKEEFKDFFLDWITNIAVEFGASSVYARSEYTKVFNLHLQLNTLANVDNSPVKMTIRELIQDAPEIPWVELINKYSNGLFNVTHETDIVVYAAPYFVNLVSNLRRFPKTILANYLISRIIELHYHAFGEKIRQYSDEFVKKIDENFSGEERSDYCIEKVEEYFRHVLEIVYVKRYTNIEDVQHLKIMIDKIKQQIIKTVKSSDWMDESTKQEAAMRLKQIDSYIGWSQRVLEDDLDKLVPFSHVELPIDNFLLILLRLNKYKDDENLIILNKNWTELYKDSLEVMPIVDVNAFYSTSLSTLILPTPILQGGFYQRSWPNYMNYGIMGTIIGHELTHGLLLKDSAGLESEISRWWSEDMNKIFNNRTQCLINQYEEYPHHVPNFTNNGTLTLEENIPDVLGPNFAYEAYQQWINENGNEQWLPGVDYSPNQIFWIASGSFKCFQPKYSNLSCGKTRSHGVPSFGVIASMRNSPYFAKDFGCTVDNYMNPKEKCRIF